MRELRRTAAAELAHERLAHNAGSLGTRSRHHSETIGWATEKATPSAPEPELGQAMHKPSTHGLSIVS